MKRGHFLRALVGLPFGFGTFMAKKIQEQESEPHYLLNKFYVAGFQYYDGPALINEIQPDETLTLEADPDNIYDKFAVAIYREKVMLGHVPRTDNKHISRLLQKDITLRCNVIRSNPNQETWKMLKVKICL